MKVISVLDLQELLRRDAVTLVDVREADELELARIPGAIHIPLHEVPARAAELERSAPIALLCHHGMRSEMAARWLEQHGWSDLANVVGGIDAWSLHVDRDTPRY